MKDSIFVFGSNLAGIHGSGAAKYAYENCGAVWGQRVGHHGESYAIPTKDKYIVTWHIADIEYYIIMFIIYANSNRNKLFKVTQIGCGLAGFTASQIAPLFKDAPDNCWFDSAWEYWLPGKNFWGTY